MTKNVEEKRCILCNKPYNYKYQMFGRGCLDNLYELLGISRTFRMIGNKEAYLCTRIAWKNHKFFLSKKKKTKLAQKYIALNYLNRMNYEFLDDVKEKISKDIDNISTFSKNIVENISFDLNAVFYSMQYIFWQVVIAGGLLTNKKLSAILLNHSLSLFGKTPENLIVNDDEILNNIVNDITFRNKVREEIEKNQEENEIHLDNILVSFEGGDLLYALHNATMKINASKNEKNIWDIDVEINDTYDFTDFKQLKEYMDKEKNLWTDIMATTLNNFGVVSSEYGVLKIYDLKINLKLDSTKLYEEDANER